MSSCERLLEETKREGNVTRVIDNKLQFTDHHILVQQTWNVFRKYMHVYICIYRRRYISLPTIKNSMHTRHGEVFRKMSICLSYLIMWNKQFMYTFSPHLYVHCHVERYKLCGGCCYKDWKMFCQRSRAHYT